MKILNKFKPILRKRFAMTNKTILITMTIVSLFTVGITLGGIQNVYAPDDDTPVADANGPYSEELGSSIMFDGSGSSDPDGDALTFDWNFGDGNFGIDAFPEHTYLSVGTFQVCLTVDDGNDAEDTACTTAEIADTTPPDITCPLNVAINTGEDTSPANTGEATATDDPNPDPLPTLSDVVFQNPDGTTTIVRTWTATDAAGNTASCSQIITVVPLSVDIDIKPGSFPNSVNFKNKGVLPVAILTTDTFDATTVDPETVIFDIFQINGSTPPNMCAIEDVDGDGDLDLVCHFSIPEIDHKCQGDVDGRVVHATGQILADTFDGLPIQGLDSIRWVQCPTIG